MNPNAGIDLVNRQQQEFRDLLSRQKGEESGMFADFGRAISQQQRLPDVLRQAQNERGLGDLQNNINLFQGQISGVKQMLDRLPENLRQRTAGTFTTQAVLDRQNAVEGGGLRTQLSRMAAGLEPVVKAYELASGDIGQLLEATSRQQDRELMPFTERFAFVSDRFAREVTGFTQGKQNELSVLLDKLERDRELNDREWKKANELAASEREYAYRKKLLEDEARMNSQLPRALPGAGGNIGPNSRISFDGGTPISMSGGGINLQSSGGLSFIR
jgi:hypothetical protein